MEKLQNLRDNLQDAEEKVETAKDLLMDYLGPIIKKLYDMEKLTGDFHSFYGPYGPNNEYTVELRREVGPGGPYDYSYRVPRAVFEAVDAEAAAAELARQQAREAERGRKAAIRAEINRLRAQL